MISQHWRFPAIISLSILVGMPALGDMMLNPADVMTAGTRYLGALGLSWVGVTGIYKLMDHYARANVAKVAHAQALLVAEEMMALREAEQAAEQVAKNAGGTAQRPAAPKAAAPSPLIEDLVEEAEATMDIEEDVPTAVI